MNEHISSRGVIRFHHIKHAREFREFLLDDRYRPGYHFAVPEGFGIPGDPNGAFYANGRYHLMYLYHREEFPDGSDAGFCWGHITSADLVHWRFHQDALQPGDGDGGIFSGGGFVDDDGTAYITYWALPMQGGKVKGTGIGIAKSSDRHYEKWEKLPVTGLKGTKMGIQMAKTSSGEEIPLCNADPSNIWKKNGMYYLQAGNLPVLNDFGREPDSPQQYRGDWVDLFRSKDLLLWEYVHRFYQRDTNNQWTDETEDDMCPSFLPLPSSPEGGLSEKYLQLFIAHNKGCQYYIGDYDHENDVFIPETHGRMSWVDNTFFAPEALIDPKGRQIMWAWLTDDPHTNEEDKLEIGWAGVFGLPRVLWLGENNTLCIAPAPELEMLRGETVAFKVESLINEEKILCVPDGNSYEMKLTIDPRSASKTGIKVLNTENPSESVAIYYDADSKMLCLDSRTIGERGRKVLEQAPLHLDEDEALELTVFVDHSVVEVFANNRQAITRRAYPVGTVNDSVILFYEDGESAFTEVIYWEMMPSNCW